MRHKTNHFLQLLNMPALNHDHLYTIARYYGIGSQKSKDLKTMDDIVKILRRSHNKLDAISLLQKLINELEHTIIQVHK